MIRPLPFVAAVLLGAVLTSGCGQSELPQTKTYQIPMPTALDRAKNLLKQYVAGQPLGSEVTDFPQIVDEVRKTDPQKADILEKGLADLQKSKTGTAAKAQALLTQLQ